MQKSKLYFLLPICLFQTIFLFGQKENDASLLETDTTWGKEFFHFPLGFAQDIEYTGIEEAYFPKGWSKQESDDFWSYAFVWKIDHTEKLTTKDLENDLQKYFDGLMNMNKNGSKESGILKTTALFIEKETTNDNATFLGKVKTFDRFSTKKPMILNVSVEQSYCEATEKTIVFFRFSPKDFDHNIWLKLNGLHLNEDVCE